MLAVVWFVVPSFNGCPPGGFWCLSMYWITESGSWTGSSIIVLLISIAFACIPSRPLAKAMTFVRTLLVLSIILAGFARLNERFIKSTFAISRPSHRFILREAGTGIRLDSIYSLVVPERRLFFQGVIADDTVHFKGIEPRVLAHWAAESGYSMPSGHSFNAFLLAGMLAYVIFVLTERRITVWPYVPMFWAALVGLSRVELGVHTPLDVTIGGALGLVVSHGLLAIPAFRRLVIPVWKKKDVPVDAR